MVKWEDSMSTWQNQWILVFRSLSSPSQQNIFRGTISSVKNNVWEPIRGIEIRNSGHTLQTQKEKKRCEEIILHGYVVLDLPYVWEDSRDRARGISSVRLTDRQTVPILGGGDLVNMQRPQLDKLGAPSFHGTTWYTCSMTKEGPSLRIHGGFPFHHQLHQLLISSPYHLPLTDPQKPWSLTINKLERRHPGTRTTGKGPEVGFQLESSGPPDINWEQEKKDGLISSTRSAKMPFGTTEKCKACEKTVYFAEMVSADGVPYHKTCFRCSHCNGLLAVRFSL